ncbi:FCD domain-containing protein [Streptomyces sp. NBC_00006]|uniref:FadR/GntR family transcriptional regulator n=1 Tax=Streptomyces sp. NBC_00483 TaxID=2975756 RepID=UPI00225222E0|nr:FCD domain-containing protein [Streptomyces sp. NBC_00483]MCX5535865.1 FCD domain-containing protein [Streptomyces sp. NBC_00006]
MPSEAELTRMFVASRGTVREALRLLTSQHLVVTTRGVTGGSFVSTPSASSVAENLGGSLGLLVNAENLTVGNLLEGRLILEPVAAGLAAERSDRDALETLRATAASTGDLAPARGFTVHWDFHAALVSATGNPLLTLMCRPINEVLSGRLHRDRVAREQWHEVDADHITILRAVEDGDAAAAERLTREHLIRLRHLYEQVEASTPRQGE